MSELLHNDFYTLANSQLFPIHEQNSVKAENNQNEAYTWAVKTYANYFANGAKAALDLYRLAIERFPQQPFFYACRALLNKELNDSEGAYYDYQVAKNLDVNYHHFLEWKDNAGQMQESEELQELQQKLATVNTDPQLYVNRAALYVQHFCYQEAVDDFDQAYKLRPNPEYLLSSAAVHMHMLHYAEALQLLNSLIFNNTQLLDAYLYRGKLYVAIHEFARAEEDFNNCVSQAGDNKLYFEERAGFYEKIGDNERAICDYSQLITLDTEDFFPYVMRADLYAKVGELTLAIEDYDKAININPYYSDLYDYRASLKKQIGDVVGAAQDRMIFEELERDD